MLNLDHLVAEEAGLTLSKEQGIPQEVVAFLESVTWGTDGALYEHLDTADHIRRLADPHLVLLRKDGEIAATAIFSRRTGRTGTLEMPFYFVRYFAASPIIRGTGIIKRNGPAFMHGIREGEAGKTVFMGIIEEGNHRSMKVATAAGQRPIATIQTVGFSRFFPKDDPRVRQIREEEREPIRRLIDAQYAGHSMVHHHTLFDRAEYFVLEEGGEIVAGAQVQEGHWRMRGMPGLTGRLVMKVLPRLPLLRRIFNPNDFRFLSFEYIYLKPGHENALYSLMEALLHRFGRNSALLWFDERAPLYQTLRRQGRLGIIDRFTRGTKVFIMASFVHLTPEEEALVAGRPWFTTGFDFM